MTAQPIPITTLAARVLHDARTKDWRIQRIIEVVAKAFDVDPEDVTGPEHRPEFVIPRHICMYLARKRSGYSLPQIGRVFGARNHATVIYGIRRVERMQESEMCRELLRRIEEELDRG